MLVIEFPDLKDITMAHQASGNVATKGGMQDRINSNLARDGAAKRPQKSFPTTHGMRDVTAELSGVSPANPGVGPDGGAANPLAPTAPGKKVQSSFPTKWGHRDRNGASASDGGRVLSEASNLGK